MMQAILSIRTPGYVGVPKEVEFHSRELFHARSSVVWERKIDAGKAFDLSSLLDQVAEGCPATDERRAIKAMLRAKVPYHIRGCSRRMKRL
jgi:hypothetical protein